MATSTTTTDYNKFIQPYLERLAGKTEAAIETPYAPYTGERVAGISGMQEEAMQRIMGLAPSAAGEAGIGLAQRAGEQALGLGAAYTPYQTGQFTGDVAQQYMSPYMQSVVDIEKREAQRQSDIARTGRQAAATKAGAFGGARQAIEEAEAQRNLSTQLGDIQTKGSQAAFQAAQDMYAKEQTLGEQSRQAALNAGIQGAQAATAAGTGLGNLGQTQFGQTSDIISGIGSYGGLQREIEQGKLDVGYGDYAAKQAYPYEQLGFASNIYNQMPQTTAIQTTQGAGTSGLASTIGALGSLFSLGKGLSIFNEGGQVNGYSMGGTAKANPTELDAAMKYIPDAGLQRMAALPNVTELAKAQIAKKLEGNQDLRAAAQAQPTQPQQPTVAEEAVRQLYAGLGGAELPQDFMAPAMMAGGGIVALAGGGDFDRESRRSGAASMPTFEDPAYRQESSLAPSGIAQSVASGAVRPAAAPAGGDRYAKYREFGKAQAAKLEGLGQEYANLLNDPEALADRTRLEEAIKAQPEYGLGLEKMYKEDLEGLDKQSQSDMWFAAARAFANFGTAEKGEEGKKLAESLGLAAEDISKIKRADKAYQRAVQKDLALLGEERIAKKLGREKDLYDIRDKRRENDLKLKKLQVELATEGAKIASEVEQNIFSAQTQMAVAGTYAGGKSGSPGKMSVDALKAMQTTLTSELNTLRRNLANTFIDADKQALQTQISAKEAELAAVRNELGSRGGLTSTTGATGTSGLATQGGRLVPQTPSGGVNSSLFNQADAILAGSQ